MNFGDWLKQTRTTHNILIEELAKRSDVTGATISRIENHKSEPIVETAVKLVNALSTPAQAFAEMGMPLPDYAKIRKAGKYRLGRQEIEHWISYIDSHQKQSDAFIKRWLNILNLEASVTEKDQLPTISSIMKCLSKGRNCLNWPPSSEDNFLLSLYLNNEYISYFDIGLYIRQKRLAKGLSLRAVQELSGLSDSLLQRIENGDAGTIKMDVFFDIHEMLDDGGFGALAEIQAAIHSVRTKIRILTLGDNKYLGGDYSHILARIDALVGLYRWISRTPKKDLFLDEFFSLLKN